MNSILNQVARANINTRVMFDVAFTKAGYDKKVAKNIHLYGATARVEWMIKNGYEHEAMAMWMKVKITN